jgi:hypothetical protein
MGQWWRVKPPIDSEFMVLVVSGRVAAFQRSYYLFSVGDLWADARRMLDKSQFTYEFEKDWPVKPVKKARARSKTL